MLKESEDIRLYALIEPFNLKMTMVFGPTAKVCKNCINSADIHNFIEQFLKNYDVKYQTGRVESNGSWILPQFKISDFMEDKSHIVVYSVEYGMCHTSLPQDKSDYTTNLQSINSFQLLTDQDINEKFISKKTHRNKKLKPIKNKPNMHKQHDDLSNQSKLNPNKPNVLNQNKMQSCSLGFINNSIGIKESQNCQQKQKDKNQSYNKGPESAQKRSISPSSADVSTIYTGCINKNPDLMMPNVSNEEGKESIKLVTDEEDEVFFNNTKRQKLNDKKLNEVDKRHTESDDDASSTSYFDDISSSSKVKPLNMKK